MMNVLTVSDKKPFATQEPPEHCHSHVQNGKPESHHGDRHGYYCRSFLRSSKRDGAEQVADQQASAISQENRCRIEVVAEESRNRPR